MPVRNITENEMNKAPGRSERLSGLPYSFSCFFSSFKNNMFNYSWYALTIKAQPSFFFCSFSVLWAHCGCQSRSQLIEYFTMLSFPSRRKGCSELRAKCSSVLVLLGLTLKKASLLLGLLEARSVFKSDDNKWCGLLWAFSKAKARQESKLIYMLLSAVWLIFILICNLKSHSSFALSSLGPTRALLINQVSDICINGRLQAWKHQAKVYLVTNRANFISHFFS